MKKSFKNLKTLQFEKVSGFSNILDSKLKLIKYMVFNILNSNRTKEISYKKLAIFKILTLSRNKSNIITTAFEKWRSKSKLFKEKIERIHIKTKQTIFSGFSNYFS